MDRVRNHIIRKASVNFQVTGNEDGMAFQQAVTEWCRHVLSPTLDAVLEEYALTDDVLSIDHINLDIGLDMAGDWEKELVESIIHQLNENIGLKKIAGGQGIIKSEVVSFTETMAYYLNHGILPWNASFTNDIDFETEAGRWLKSLSSSELKNLVKNLRDDRSVSRFTGLLRDGDLERIMAEASGEPEESFITLINDMNFIIDFLTEDMLLRQSLKRQMKEMLILGLAPDQDLKRRYTEWISGTGEKFPLPIRRIDTGSLSNPELKKIISAFQHGKAGKSKPRPGRSFEKPEDRYTDLLNKPDKKDKKTDREFTEGVFIDNAGAVIIAPFLTMMFSRSGLTEENKIIDTSAAVNLVHYCITGRTAAQEYELLLPKILCGLETGFVPGTVNITDAKIIKEADEMRASVIEYWTVLKDTSVDGLRESFLVRNGKLTFIDDEWLLKVEQKPFDMLLEHLPWNIGMIKLPWMKNLIRTQWI